MPPVSGTGRWSGAAVYRLNAPVAARTSYGASTSAAFAPSLLITTTAVGFCGSGAAGGAAAGAAGAVASRGVNTPSAAVIIPVAPTAIGTASPASTDAEGETPARHGRPP